MKSVAEELSYLFFYRDLNAAYLQKGNATSQSYFQIYFLKMQQLIMNCFSDVFLYFKIINESCESHCLIIF